MTARRSDKNSEKATDGLLRQILQNTPEKGAAAGTCPEPEILAAYFERSLDDQEMAAYDLHLSQCSRCRDQQAAMVRAQLPVRTVVGDEPRRAWLWDWRWLAPATAVLAVAIVWYVRRSEMTAQKIQELPTLAMARSSESPLQPLAENSPTPLSAAPANGALKKTERQDGALRGSAPAPADTESRELAARKAASDLASNLETDTTSKDSDTLRPDARAATALAPREPAAAPPTAAPQNEVTTAIPTAPPSAEAKTKHAQVLALTSRNENLAASPRLAQPLLRTPNPQFLWRIAAAGIVERSTDSGVTWTRQFQSEAVQLTAGAAPAENTCWLVGRGGLILLTTNAVDWMMITSPAKTDFTGIVANSGSEATVSAADGRKFMTKDGGKSWTPAP